MITSKQAGAVTTIVHDYSGDDNVGLLYLTSDLHIDSVYCNRDALMSDLEEAKKRNAIVFLLGDVFDAMQGRFDPRRSLDELRQEYRRNDYYVPIVSETLSNSGKVVFQTTHHIRTPGYKQEYGDGTQGWAVEKGFVPKPIGGAFVQYEVHQHGLNKGKPTNIYTDIRVMPLIHAPDVSGL